MNRKIAALMAGLTVISILSGCQKHSDREYEDLQYEYNDLQFRYDELKNEYDILQDEVSAEYMTPDDYYKLSEFAGANDFKSTGFYSSAYCVVLETGGKTTIRIGYDVYDSSIYYETDNNHCDAEFGDWDDYGRCAFTLTGKSEGITYFTFTNDNDSRTFQIVVFVVD